MIDTFERRKNFIVPTFIAVVVAPLALLLMVVGARSPYTHVNLDAGFDSNYSRSIQAPVGYIELTHGAGLAAPPAADPVERGKQLFVADGCASCHGLTGSGGIIGPVIVGTDAKTLGAKTDRGPGGMPAYAPGAIPDDDLQAIAAYLKASGSSK